jgi:hypothetical protein
MFTLHGIFVEMFMTEAEAKRHFKFVSSLKFKIIFRQSASAERLWLFDFHI